MLCWLRPRNSERQKPQRCWRQRQPFAGNARPRSCWSQSAPVSERKRLIICSMLLRKKRRWSSRMITNTLYRSFARWPHAQKQVRRVLSRLPPRRRLVDHFGLHLLVDPTELSGYYLYYERAYDVEVFRFLDSRLP